MNDKTQLEKIAEIFEQVGSEIMRHQKDGLSYYEAAEKTLDLCQPKWIDVPDVSADIEWCRVIIGGCEQELFYRCINNRWEFQTDNGLWAKSGFVPNYYFVMPKPPGESE